MSYGEKIKKVGEDLKVLALKFYGECCDVYVDKETPISSICIVKDDKRGMQVWYSLRCPCVMDFFGCIESVLASSGDGAG